VGGLGDLGDLGEGIPISKSRFLAANSEASDGERRKWESALLTSAPSKLYGKIEKWSRDDA